MSKYRAIMTSPTSLRANAAITRDGLLLHYASSGGDVVEVTSAASTEPMAVSLVSAAAGDYFAAALLSQTDTVNILSGAAISLGAALYTAANGKVQPLPSGPGTYYRIGTALSAVDAANKLVSVALQPTTKTIVESVP